MELNLSRGQIRELHQSQGNRSAFINIINYIVINESLSATIGWHMYTHSEILKAMMKTKKVKTRGNDSATVQ